MYAMIRRYSYKGTVDRKSIDDFKGRIESKFVPRVQDIRGFHSYFVVGVSEQELVTIGIFEDKAGAAESVRRAAFVGTALRVPAAVSPHFAWKTKPVSTA